MKKVFCLIVIVLAVALTAQNHSIGIGVTSNTSGSGGSKYAPAGQENVILSKLKVLEENYLSQLPKRDYLQASMIVEEIRDILMGKEINPDNTNMDINTQVTETESSQSININMNISGFDNPMTPPTSIQPAPQPEPNVVVHEPQPVKESVKEAMNNSSFSQLIKNVSDESFSDDQLRYIRTASKSHYFTVSQVERMIDVFTFSDDKIECLSIMYPKVIDPENSFSIIGHFTYEDDKRSAEMIINQ
jgi:hypothetical protein